MRGSPQNKILKMGNNDPKERIKFGLKVLKLGFKVLNLEKIGKRYRDLV